MVLLLLMAALAGFVSWKYADDLKAYALDGVRETITTTVSFDEDVVLSLWRDFPLIAVEISDIKVEDAFKTDTLLAVERAYVQFNLLKILQNKFTIEGIRLADGSFKLRRNADNQWNFRVWKEPESSPNKNTKVDFSIDILTLQNIQLDYDDRVVDLNIQFLSNKSKIKGRFTNENTRLGLSLKGFMHQLTINNTKQITELPLNLAGVLNINTKDGIYTIEMGNAVLAGNEMVLDAEWTRIENGTDMQLKVHAGNIDPFVLLPHIWPQIPENILKLKLEGKADLIINLNGPFTATKGPELDANIEVRNGGLEFQQTPVSQLNLKGKLFMKDIKRSKAMEITFDSFSLKTPKGNASGKGTLTDLTNPHLKLAITGASRLEELVKVAALEQQVQAHGGIGWNLNFEGPLGREFHTTINELKQMKWSGSVSLSEATLQFNSSIPKMEQLNAAIEMTPQSTSVTECTGKIGHLQFAGATEIDQFKEILTDSTAPIRLKGNVRIAELDVQKLPKEWEFETASAESSGSSRVVSGQIAATIDKLIYNDFVATSVVGDLYMHNEKLEVTGLKMNALDGTIATNLTYQPTQAGYLLNLNSALQNIDMHRTLKEWDNFGQTGIVAENLKGRASAKLSANIHLNKDHEIIPNKLQVESDVEISGGELLAFEPLLAMSRFISVDELNHVKFDTLRNQLSIKNSTLYIPKMSVISNILNVQVYGQHGFNQDMDYHVNLLLTDILRRKSKRKKTFEGHEIIDEKGKTRLFLWVRGQPGNIKVGFDKKEVRQKLKADFKKEGQTLKQLFKEEFGGGQKAETQTEAVNFELIPEEEEKSITPQAESKPTPSTKQSTKPKKKKGFFSRQDNEEEDTEGSFEIEFEP